MNAILIATLTVFFIGALESAVKGKTGGATIGAAITAFIGLLFVVMLNLVRWMIE